MIGQEGSASYEELNEDMEQVASGLMSGAEEVDEEDGSSTILPDSNSPSLRFSKSCLKNVFSVILLFIYLLLMAVAIFLVYQTITDFREKLKHPVMSVSYKEVPFYDAPGIALYPGKAELLTCKHHYYDYILPLVNPGQPGKIECTIQRINYTDPFTNQTKKHAVIVQGPKEVKKRELVFMQFHLNETDQDFSAIDYLLFSSFQEFLNSPNKSEFMKRCESSYSSWKFSGGFRTWVKMSLVKTKEEDGRETVEFRQEISVVNYIERRTEAGGDQLFFVVFEWKDPFIQEVQDVPYLYFCVENVAIGNLKVVVEGNFHATGAQIVSFGKVGLILVVVEFENERKRTVSWEDSCMKQIITANPWNMIALLCGIFLALFKAADFAKLSVKWMIKIRKRHLKRRSQVLNHIS